MNQYNTLEDENRERITDGTFDDWSKDEHNTNNRSIDLMGMSFGLLKVVGKSSKRSQKGEVIWECECWCGNRTEARGSSLRSKHTQSCGCMKSQRVIYPNLIFAMTK